MAGHGHVRLLRGGGGRIARHESFAETLHHAIAAAAGQASGNFAFTQGSGMELYLAAGTAARNGVVSALLAGGGFRGSSDPLEAVDGVFSP